MKDGAPKRTKKKQATDPGELEYTPIRRRRAKNAGAVMLSEDEISVAYDSPNEDRSNAPSLPPDAPHMLPEVSPVVDEGACELSEDAEDTLHDTEENNDSLPVNDAAPLDAASEQIHTEAHEEESSFDASFAESDSEHISLEPQHVPQPQNEHTIPEGTRYERVVLPDEISLVGVLPLEDEVDPGENGESDQAEPQETDETLEAEAEASEAISEPEAAEEVEDDEEFVFTPMPTPVVYERVVLPDEISLVDVFHEFNIPVAAQEEPIQATEPSEEGAQNELPADTDENSAPSDVADDVDAEESAPDAEPPIGQADALTEQEHSLAQQNTDEPEKPSSETVDTAEDTAIEESIPEKDPLAAEFDFSEIDFDSLVSTQAAEKTSEGSETDELTDEAGEIDGEHTEESTLPTATTEDEEENPATEEAPEHTPEALQDEDNTAPDTRASATEDDELAEVRPQAESEASARVEPKAAREKKPAPEERPIESRFDIVELFAFTLALVFILTTFFFRSSTVQGSSMANTLHDGDQLILYSFLYEPEVGDIIVFEDYTTPHKEPLVKRVIATEGQTVTVLDAYTVLVDGVPLPQEYVYVDAYDDYEYPIQCTVSKGHLFVMGDHRNASSDSRAFGEVSKSTVLGKVILRYYPFEDFRNFK